MNPESGGRSVAVVPITAKSGLYRISDGTRTALAAAGALNPIELADVRTVRTSWKPVAEATGGSVNWAGTGTSPAGHPPGRAGRDAAGARLDRLPRQWRLYRHRPARDAADAGGASDRAASRVMASSRSAVTDPTAIADGTPLA
jgi:hypothetical protein